METRNIILGMELGEDRSRVCVYDRTSREVVSLRLWNDEESFPTAVSRVTDQEIWYAGQEAAEQKPDCMVVLLDHLYEIADSRNNTAVENQWYAPEELLAKFLAGVLKQAGIENPGKQLSAMMITCTRLTRNLVENVRRAYEILGIPRGKGYLQENDESFFYHTISQKPELWSRTVGCFCVEQDSASFLKLSVSSRTKPSTARVERVAKQRLSIRPDVRDREFAELVRTAMGMEVYTSVYITGQGFSQNWATESLKELSKRRCKLFGGENLFAAGACYAAREKVDERNIRGILFLGNDLIRSSISMELIANGSRTNYVFLNAGTHWYEAEKECELFLDETEKLEFLATSMENGKVSRYTMHLEGVPKRPKRTTRLLLKMEYQSPTELKITVEDLGFGEIFPASGKIWTETLEEVRKNS